MLKWKIKNIKDYINIIDVIYNCKNYKLNY